MKKLILTILSFLIFSFSMANSIQLQSELDTNSILIGEQTTLSVNISFEKGKRIVFPLLQDTISKHIEIVGDIEIDTSYTDNRINIEHRYTITSFDSGFHVIPYFYAFAFNPSDTIVLKSELILLEVRNIAVDMNDEIKDISAPLKAPLTIKEAALYIGGVLLIILFAFLIIYIIRKLVRKEPIIQLKPKKIVPPYLIALDALNEIERQKLWQNNKVKEFYIRLSDVIRSYIEGQFQLPATDRLTSEIDDLLKSKNFDRDLISKIVEVLTRADFAKFAKGIPLPNENSQSISIAFEFVEKTKPHDELKEEVKQ